MTLVAEERPEGTLSDVAADENFIVEPDVVRAVRVRGGGGVRVAGRGDQGVPPRRAWEDRRRGTPSEDGAAGAARRPRRRRRRVGRRDDRRRRRGKSPRRRSRRGRRGWTGDHARPNATSGRHGGTPRRSERRRPSGSPPPRRRAEGGKSSSSGGCESVLGRGQRDDVGERDAFTPSAGPPSASPTRVVAVDPLVALALDAATAVATATTRGRSANETAGTFVKTVVATRGSRSFSRRMSRPPTCAP